MVQLKCIAAFDITILHFCVTSLEDFGLVAYDEYTHL